jgi:hypothetical protein
VATVLVVISAVASACTMLRQEVTPSPPACPAALLSGQLAPAEGGAGVLEPDFDEVTPVTWPDGYTVETGPSVVLRDPAKAVIAR